MKASLGEDMLAGKWVDIEAPDVASNYQKFAAAVASGEQDEPSFRRAAEIQKILDLAVEADKTGCETSLK